MADIPFSSVSGGGDFTVKYISASLSILAGSSGTLATITPPFGQRVRLSLLASADTGTEADMQVRADGVDLLNPAKNKIGIANSGSAVLLDGVVVVGGTNKIHSAITLNTNQVLTIVKETGSTTNDLVYAYEFGV